MNEIVERMHWFINPRKRGLTLLSCFIGGALCILFLSFFAEKLNHRANGFIRLAPPHVSMPEEIRDIRFNGFYFAGGTPTHFYLANHMAPNLVMTMTTALTDSAIDRFSLQTAGGRFAKALRVIIDSPHIYLFEGITPTIAYGEVGDSLLHRRPAKLYFSVAEPLSPVSRVFRAVDDRLRQNVLVKQLNESFIKGDHVLEKQVDGIFCTDGTLLAQPDSNRLVYVYHYRNQFICLDTNLRVRYRGKTIDTVSRVKFAVDRIPTQRSITLSSPPEFVNEQSCVSGNYLFIHSALHADNEELSMFQRTSPIDVYSLLDGSYILSFYLPDYRQKKIQDFGVFGNTLVALYDHWLYTYTLNIPTKMRK